MSQDSALQIGAPKAPGAGNTMKLASAALNLKKRGPRPALFGCHIATKPIPRYLTRMTRFFDMDDRARLRERFYGESRSILAYL